MRAQTRSDATLENFHKKSQELQVLKKSTSCLPSCFVFGADKFRTDSTTSWNWSFQLFPISYCNSFPSEVFLLFYSKISPFLSNISELSSNFHWIFIEFCRCFLYYSVEILKMSGFMNNHEVKNVMWRDRTGDTGLPLGTTLHLGIDEMLWPVSQIIGHFVRSLFEI